MPVLMAELLTSSSRWSETRRAVNEMVAALPARARSARLVFAFYDCEHDDVLIHAALRSHFPDARLIGGTSSGGVMTERGYMGSSSMALMALLDREGDYGVACTRLGDDPAGAAEAALRAALADCDCSGQLPDLVWIYQAPGHEEAVVAGLRRVVGDHCAIVGGSAADNELSGRWRLLGTEGVCGEGLAVAAIFGSGDAAVAFEGGYEPTGASGIVTAVERPPAGRCIRSIDGEPAAVVYDRWAGGCIVEALGQGGTILTSSTLAPLGIDAGETDGVRRFILVHPQAVGQGNSLSVFCQVNEGERLFAMRGDRRHLIERAGRLAREVRRQLQARHEQLAGALVVFCAGCKLAVHSDIDLVVDAVRNSLGDVPFIGCFTFGEQGQLGEHNVHGNLMISVVAFGRPVETP